MIKVSDLVHVQVVAKGPRGRERSENREALQLELQVGQTASRPELHDTEDD
jgi:hypothetical protein